jgi:LysR family transcriptional regulator, glycine cleavage system transcriptional activator
MPGFMGYRLPPLNNLRHFEAAGRHLSFKHAARELEMTPSAVSHGIQTLEEWLGVQLFARTRRSLKLTDAGKEYLPSVQNALSLLAGASERVPSTTPRSILSISVAPTFAARLLLPRLARFRELNPAIRVHIDTDRRQIEFPRDGRDLAIRLGHRPPFELGSVRLLSERLVPVCSPKLLEALGFPRALCDAPLIHVTSVSCDWETWASLANQEPINCQRGLLVDTIQMAVDAAVAGLGVAVGRRPIIDEELSDGRLVPFCGPTVIAPTSYWLVGLPQTMDRPEISSFRDWVSNEMRQLGDLSHSSSTE